MSSSVSCAVTYHSPCARSLLSTLRQSFQTRHKPSSRNSILLFALAPSATTPPDVLSDITSTLSRLSPEHVGCISAPLPYQRSNPRIRSDPGCSLAYAFVDGISFQSTIPGRADVYVGRWHAARSRCIGGARRVTQANTVDSQTQIFNDLSRSDGKADWERVWSHSALAEMSSLSSGHANDLDSEMLPNGLRNTDPSTVDNIFCFSDNAPEGLATVLQRAFPRANKLSLIASSTPFITGRPVTLFYNGSILSNGTIGIAFTSRPSSPLPAPELSFPPLVALSGNLNVTCSDGNLILSLDSGNPTQLLLSAIRKHGLSSLHTTWVGKDDEFYVGVIDPSSQQISQLHRIRAGNPSRGGIALDASLAPRKGALVRFYHLPRDAASGASARILDTIADGNISLFVAPEMEANLEQEIADDTVADSNHSVVSGAFLAASENGFALSHGAQGHWKCIVPGGCVRLSL